MKQLGLGKNARRCTKRGQLLQNIITLFSCFFPFVLIMTVRGRTVYALGYLDEARMLVIFELVRALPMVLPALVEHDVLVSSADAGRQDLLAAVSAFRRFHLNVLR